MSVKLWEVATSNAFSTTLNGTIASGDTEIVLTSTTGLVSPGILVIDRQDANGVDSPTAREYISYTGISDKTLTGCTRGLAGSTGQAHNSGARVEEVMSVTHWGDMVDFIEYGHNTDGTHKDITQTMLTMSGRASAPSTPVSGYGLVYFKTDGKLYKKYDDGLESEVGAGGGASFWTEMPGTPTRVSDTQFTITDTGNADSLDKVLGKGTIIKWLESTTVQMAMVTSSSYNTNVVTVNIVGNSLTAGFTEMKYCIQRAMEEHFIITPFPTAATSNLSKTFYLKEESYLISYDLQLTGAGSGSGSTIVDINDDGTTLATTKAAITSTNTQDLDNVLDAVSANTLTSTAKDSAITVDVDSVTSTAPVGDGIVTLFYIPVSWRYR